MKRTVITSFTDKGYDQYGREFIRTFLEFWPKTVRLVVFWEGPPVDLGERVEVRSILDVEGWPEAAERLSAFPIFHGQMPDGKFNMQLDAFQWRKPFMEAQALKDYGGKVFWIDADTITHSAVPDDFLDECLQDGKLSCYVGRDGWFYTESGFIGFNAEHDMCEKFMGAYLRIFWTGACFMLQGWHDCTGYDAVRKSGDPEWFVNLADGVPNGTMHPLINCRLGAYLDHRKGNRKLSGSRREDLVVDRTEPYWQGRAA